jgi:hypothetical protein
MGMRAGSGARAGRAMPAAGGGSWRYLYERLGEKRFQQLCAALLAHVFPDVACYPVGQKDGGRDAMRSERGCRYVYQVKWTNKRLRDPVAWLDEAIREETANIRRLVSEGAEAYILLTCVAGTGARDRGTMDRLDERLKSHSEAFGIPMSCWWQADIDARIDTAPKELKWAYSEMLAGHDLVRCLIESGVLEARDRELGTLLRKVVATQWQEDAKVRFRQVDMDNYDLTDLYVDVAARYVQGRRNGPRLADDPAELGGAAAHLLKSRAALTVVRGAPGQGKSTLSQYLCQVHRAEFLAHPDYLGGRRPGLQADEPRLPLRVELRDYAVWLEGGDPLGDGDAEPPRRKRPRPGSVEAFLAYLMRHRSGGLPATVSTVMDVLGRFAMLIVLDGLDEVPEKDTRARVVAEINEFTGRLAGTAVAQQVIVTTRPNASGLPEPSPETFDTIELTSLSPALRQEYLRKWANAHSIHGPDRRKLQRIFDQRTAEPHIAQLADNPMQLTILLYLMHRRQEAVPERRTELYTAYMETLFGREQAKPSLVRKYRKDLEEVTAFLGWHLQATGETEAINGRLPTQAVRRAINDYLFTMGKDTSVVDALFDGVTQRIWALTTKISGTYEFDVQPVREYFAARYLYAYAEASSPRSHKSAILQHLARRAHWLNTCRFYAGFANPNEISGLVEGLEEEFEEGNHPHQTRLAAWTLLADGVFDARPRTQQRAVRLFLDDLSVRLLDQELGTGSWVTKFADENAAAMLSSALRDSVAANPSGPLNSERLRIAWQMQPDRAVFDAWWRPRVGQAIGTGSEQAWLQAGIPFQGGQRLSATHVSRLNLADPGSAAAALQAGVVPLPDSPDEAQLVHAVLSGLCSEVPVTAAGYAGDILRLLAPQNFLRKASRDSRPYGIDYGHADMNVTDQQRLAILRRLKSRDSRFDRIQAASRTGRGQAGTTSTWGNTARGVSELFGPCWLAAEIAVIGAASSSEDYRTEGDLTPGRAPLGNHPDYGRLLQELRLNRSRASWWTSQAQMHPDPLSRATWALGLVAIADDNVLSQCLGQLADGLRELPAPFLHALCYSSSRIASAELNCQRQEHCISQATEVSPLAWMLAAHHASDVETTCMRTGPDDEKLASLAVYGIAAWPASYALTWRAERRPSGNLLACLRRYGPRACPQNLVIDDIPVELMRDVIKEPANVPLAWVTAAAQAVSDHAEEPPLADIAGRQCWFA